MPPLPSRAAPRLALVFSIALCGAALDRPATGQGPAFTARELPVVATAEGGFDFLEAVKITDTGLVAGNANPFDGTFSYESHVGFLFDPASGSMALDPVGARRSDATFMNERGDVFGIASDRDYTRNTLFVYSGKTGLERLRTPRAWIRNDFIPSAFNEHGDVAGIGYFRRRPGGRALRTLALLRLRGDRWRDLKRLDSRLVPAAHEAQAVLLNNDRDLVVNADTGVFGIFAGGSPRQIGPPDQEVRAFALGPRGGVVGYVREPGFFNGKFIEGEGPRRAFVYRPRKGFLELHGSQFKRSEAKWITASGVVGGFGTVERGLDTVFTVDQSGEMRSISLRERLDHLGLGLRFRNADVVDMNDRRQFLLEIKVRPKPEKDCLSVPKGWTFYFLDPDAGLVDLQAVLDRQGLDLEIFDLVDLNNRGQILAQACRPNGSWTAVVLTPE